MDKHTNQTSHLNNHHFQIIVREVYLNPLPYLNHEQDQIP